MARSSYVYLLQEATGGVLAAKTVKHEAARLYNQLIQECPKITIRRLADNMTERRGVIMSVDELFKGTGLEPGSACIRVVPKRVTQNV